MSQPPIETIAEAFSRTAEKYDQFAKDHPNLTRIRIKVYQHFLRFAAPGSRILELNAGTGTDAVHLARQGFHVHATDISPGMLDRLRSKADSLDLGDNLSIQKRSFTELGDLEEGPFDAVFSNLGGLNCIPDLRLVTQNLPPLLRPGGLVTWVLMPPICLWELGMAITGQFRYAIRRLSPGGTQAHLEGKYFKVHYFTPQQTIKAFGSQFVPLAVEGLSIFAPPAESKHLARKYPRLYRTLCWLDDHISDTKPWRGWGDFFIISLRYQPNHE